MYYYIRGIIMYFYINSMYLYVNITPLFGSVYKTGGGQKKPSATTTTDLQILEICQSEQLLGNEGRYDDDAPVENFLKMCVEEEVHSGTDGTPQSKVDENEGQEVVVEDNVKENEGWSRLLKKPVHKNLETHSKKTTKDVWATVAAKKVEKVELQILQLKEKHSLEKELLVLQIEEQRLKIAQLKEAGANE